MNFTPLDDAFKFNTQSEFLLQQTNSYFSPICIFCSFPDSQPLINDGGSLRRCKRCKKDFKSQIITQPVNPNQAPPQNKLNQIHNYQYMNPYAPQPKTQTELNNFNPDAYITNMNSNIYYNHNWYHFNKK